MKKITIKTTITALALTLSANIFALECGETLTQSTTMTQDLDCSNYQGFAALNLKGNKILLNGNGHRIITPTTNVGVYAEGGRIAVLNLEVEGGQKTIGFQGYNTYKLELNHVSAKGMRIGADYTTESNFSCRRLKVTNSNLSSNEIAVKVNSQSCQKPPRLLNNDFSESKNYALNIISKRFFINGLKNNNYSNSANGIIGKASELAVVKDVDFSKFNIQGNQVFIYDSKQVRVKRSNFEGSSSQTGAVHIYNSELVKVNRNSFDGNYLDLKVSNGSQATDLRINRNIATEAFVIDGNELNYSRIRLRYNDIPEGRIFIYANADIFEQK